ncbi:MAG: hypothetical protein M1820_001832 [Bogoriella megaspora]|nr:MAG: hypothetical protein M1820_001832 [Bogoriella megaspora]
MLPVIQAPEPIIPAHYDPPPEVPSEPGGTGTDPNSNAPDPDPGPSYPGNSQPAPKPEDTAASAAGMSSASNQTPFSEEGSDEFLENVHDFLDSVSSFIDALRSTTTSTTWNTDTTVSAGKSSSPTTTIDHASACSIYSTLSLACASASPFVWSLPTSSCSASPTSIDFNAPLTKRSTHKSSAASSTSTPESFLAQASCACYSSSYYVPEMWNNIGSACAAGSGTLADQAASQTGLCKTNVRGWTSTQFGKVSRTSSAVPSATGGVGSFNGGRGRVLLEVAVVVIIAAMGS